MTELYVLYLENMEYGEEEKHLEKLLSEKRQERIQRFRFSEDKQRSLYAGLLIRYLISLRLHWENKFIRFETNEFGKPYLCGVNSFSFNLSHSGRIIFCGISSGEIGVDVEERKQYDDAIARRYFTREEYKILEKKQGRELAGQFFDFWCLKESYVKYWGTGLSQTLPDTVRRPDTDSLIWENLNFGPHYSAAVCTGQAIKGEIKRVTPGQIKAMLRFK